MKITDRLKRRFWAKVWKREGCWIWTGSIGKSGYGTFNGGNENDLATYSAHVVAYAIHHGLETVDLYVCHTCNNTRCVKPDHLFLGTASQNQQHASLTGVHSQLKVSNEDVLEIRFLAGLGLSQEWIAQRFKISRSQVSHIATRKQRTGV